MGGGGGGSRALRAKAGKAPKVVPEPEPELEPEPEPEDTRQPERQRKDRPLAGRPPILHGAFGGGLGETEGRPALQRGVHMMRLGVPSSVRVSCGSAPLRKKGPRRRECAHECAHECAPRMRTTTS